MKGISPSRGLSCWLLFALSGCYSPSRVSVLDRAQASLVQPSDAPRSEGELTLSAALNRAVQRSGELAVGRARVEEARAREGAAYAVENPELRVSQLQLDQVLRGETQLSASLRFRPPRPMEGSALRASAEAETRGEQAELDLARRAIEGDVAVAYVEALVAQERVELLTKKLTLVSALGQAVAQASEAGQALALDFSKVKLSSSMLSLEVSEARADLADKLAVLGGWVGMNLEPSDLRVPFDGEPSQEEDVEQLVRTALSAAPSLGVPAAEIEAAEALEVAEQSKQWPWFSFIDLGYAFGPKTEDPLGFSLGFGVTLPVFDINQGAVDSARASRATGQATLAAEAQRISDDVRSAHRRLRAAEEHEKTVRTGAGAATKEWLDAIAEANAAGRLELREKLKLELDVVEAEERISEAHARTLLARIELLRLTGRLSPPAPH